MLTIYSKSQCPHCDSAKIFLRSRGILYTEISVDRDPQAREFLMAQGHRSVPQIYLNGELFVEGGYQGLKNLTDTELKSRLGDQHVG